MKNTESVELIKELVDENVNPTEMYYHDTIIKEVEQSERKGITQIKAEFPDHSIVIYRSIDPINYRPIIGIVVDDTQLGKFYNMEVVQNIFNTNSNKNADDELIAEIIQDITKYLSYIS